MIEALKSVRTAHPEPASAALPQPFRLFADGGEDGPCAVVFLRRRGLLAAGGAAPSFAAHRRGQPPRGEASWH